MKRKVLSALGIAAKGVGVYFRHLFYRLRWGQYCPDPRRVIWISVEDVLYKKEPIFKGGRRFGTSILGGAWDERIRDDVENYDHKASCQHGLIRVEEFLLYKAIARMVSEGQRWEETPIYRQRLSRRVMSDAELSSEGEKIVGLIDALRNGGFVTQAELRTERPRWKEYFLPAMHKEVQIAIGRNGGMFLEDGVHRFFVAKALGIREIPVRIILRHKDWQRKRARVLMALNQQGGKGRELAGEHPDVCCLGSRHPTGQSV